MNLIIRFTLIASIILISVFSFGQEKEITNSSLETLNYDIEENLFKNNYQVLAYNYGYNQKLKAGQITLIYDETLNKRFNKTKLNWSQFQTLLYILKNNKKVIINIKNGNVFVEYQRPNN